MIYFFHTSDLDDAPDSRPLLEALLAGDQPVEILGDLAGLAADGHASLAPLSNAQGLIIISPYAPRAVRWMLAAAGIDLPDDARCLSTREQTREQLLAAIDDRLPQVTQASRHQADRALADLPPAGPWRPWYPAIDRDRCNACGQCIAFCLFGVYTVDATGQPLVSQPASCKNNCPACARTCPQQAIIFPKHPAAAICGSETDPADEAIGFADMNDPNLIAQLRKRAEAARIEAQQRKDPDS